MVVWQGLGILVPFVVIVTMAAVQGLADLVMGGGFYSHHAATQVTAALLAAVLVTALGLYLRGKGGRVVIDKETGREIVLRRRHTLFFIPIEYWGLVVLVLGAFVTFGK